MLTIRYARCHSPGFKRAVEFLHKESDEVFETYCPGEPDDWTIEQRRETLGVIRDSERTRLRTVRHELRVILTRLYRRLPIRTTESGRMLIRSNRQSEDADVVDVEVIDLQRRFAQTGRSLGYVEEALQSWTDWNVDSGRLPVFLTVNLPESEVEDVEESLDVGS